ncbi:MAG: DUF1828 domain-containing protein [Methanoregula sp.]|nr:MAG: DUF1828 domain-containing protein [Methanoregula sp.]
MVCDDVVGNLLKDLGKKFKIKSGKTGCQIVTPFLDPSQDPITIQLTEIGDIIEISDQTRTKGYLFLQGVDIKPNTKQDWYFDSIIHQYEIELKNDELILHSNKAELYEKILDFIEAIKSIQYLIYTSKARVQSAFIDDVSVWLKDNSISYAQNKEFTSDTGERIKVDFEIQRHQKDPVFAYALHSESSQYAETLTNKTIVNWIQLKGLNGNFYKLCFLDDEVDDEISVWKRQLPKLRKFSDKVLFWEERPEILPALI